MQTARRWSAFRCCKSSREKLFSKLVQVYLLQERQWKSYAVLRFPVLWNVLALQMTPSQREELKEGWPCVHVLKEGNKNFMAFSDSEHKILFLWEGRTHCSGAELLPLLQNIQFHKIWDWFFMWCTKFFNTVSLSTTENPASSPHTVILRCVLFPMLLYWVVRGDCVSFQLGKAIAQYPFPPHVLF